MIDAALIADGGQLSVMRPLAAYAFGAWTVTWPDDFDAPTLDDDRRLGFVADLPERRRPGRLARRFTRVDAEINAVDGGSNVEEILDEAAQRTAGREFFEREIGPAGFGRLVPGVDVRVNDRKPVLLWRRILPDQLVTELRFNGDGTATGQVGGQPVSDDLRRLAVNRENDQKILAERREANEAVRSVAVATKAAIRQETVAREAAIEAEASARKLGDEGEARSRRLALEAEERKRAADLKTIRDFLGGSGASDAALLSQLAAVNAQIIGMSDGKTQPAPGLLNSYLSLNTLLWEQQKEINRINERFRLDAQERQRQDAILNARQEEALQRAQTAIDNEEKYRMWPGAGPANSEWFSPRNNPFVEVRAEGNTSTVRLKRRCTGYIQLMQKMTDGRMDMWGWNVDHPAGTTFELSGGGLLKVEQFFILYQLWEP